MSKRSSAPGGAGSRDSRTTGNKGAGSTGKPGGTGQASGPSPQKAGSTSQQGSANYRARRAAATRSSTSARAASQPRASAGSSQKRGRNVPWWRSGNMAIYATIGVVAAIIIIFAIFANLQTKGSSTGSTNESPLTSASVAKAVTQVSPSVINAVGKGTVTNPLQATKGATPLDGADGKPKVVYIGADYCPFCAAERWSLVVSLSQFGTFANLHDTTSSSSDVYPDTPTFSFYGTTYASQYIDFSGVETTTRDPNTPLQTPTADEKQLLATYDAPPYTSSQNAGAIPFVDIGNTYILSGSGYSPQLLQGLTRDQIAQKLSDPNDPVTKAIVGHANELTAAICVQTQNKAPICTSSAIQAIEQQLPKGS